MSVYLVYVFEYIDEISKIGYKRIYFSKHLKPLSKEEVIKHFLCTYGTWTFVA